MGKRSNGEGSVYRRKHGRWCAAFKANGKRKYLYGRTRKEVVGKMQEALADTSNASYYPEITLEDYLGQWLRDFVKGSVRTRTYERYESVCRIHIVPEFGSRPLSSLTEMDVQSFYRRKSDAGCSARTVVYIHVTLHKALKQAVRWQRRRDSGKGSFSASLGGH